MSKISALTPQKHNLHRINVFVDGAFVCGLAESVAIRLKVGQVVSPQEILRWQEEDVFEQARLKAVRLLELRPRSTAEIRRHLQEKGYDDQVVNQVVEHLHQVKLLNDEMFVNYWVEQRETFRPRSQAALRQELQQKGVSREVMEDVLSQVDETAAARQAAAKQLTRWRSLDEQTFRVKVGGFLHRRGFHYDIIREVTNDLWQSVRADLPDDDRN